MHEKQPLLPPMCPQCRKPMKHVRTIPALGGIPPLHAFHRAPCGQAETLEDARDPEIWQHRSA